MYDDVAEGVMATVAKSQRIPRESISPTSTFEELGIDSLGGISIMFDLETEFGITIPEDSVPALRTVQDLVDGVEALLVGPAAARVAGD
ncbi:MAG: acyl carrier protein [Longimicrobiaceae bacterium]